MSRTILDIDPQKICSTYHVSSLCGKLLSKADLNDSQIQELLHSSDEMKTSQAVCVQKAAKRILQAKENHEKVFIGGDYDADGICSTAIMKDTLDRLHIPNGYYIPDRFREGYGLKPETVEKAYEKGYTLILTVDNGVKAAEAIARAKELGIDLIVSDHHTIEDPVDVKILVHPTLMEEEFCWLSGAGVALQISRTLIGDCRNHTALAAIAAVGDVMPLWKQTRVIVKNGLQAIRQGALPAARSLLRQPDTANWEELAFQIVPKLNSVGRMNDISNVNTLVPFLLCTQPVSIADYASQLNAVNEARKTQSSRMAQEAEELQDGSDFLVVYQESFQEGLCGLVAGKLAASHHKPCLVLAGSQDTVKGSGRSIPGFDLYAFFQTDFPELTAFGGHQQAVGLSLPKDQLETFEHKIHDKMSGTGFAYHQPEETAIAVQAEEINMDSLLELEQLQPYPKELSDPVFAVRNPEILSRTETAKVVKYRFRSSCGEYEGVVFRQKQLDAPQTLSLIVGRLGISRWREKISCQMNIEELKP